MIEGFVDGLVIVVCTDRDVAASHLLIAAA
jgi:hypothetical protein